MSIYINFFCINFNKFSIQKDNIGLPLIFIKHLGFVKVIGFNFYHNLQIKLVHSF